MARFTKSTFAESGVIIDSNCEIQHVPYRFSAVSNCKPGKFDEKDSRSHPQFPSCDVLVHPFGWKFYSYHRHILNEQENLITLRRIKDLLTQEYTSCKEQDDAKEEKIEITEDSNLDSVNPIKDEDYLEVNGFKLHLPPMLFGADLMMLSLPTSKGCLSISPMDALYGWVSQHTFEETQKRPLEVPKVPYASKWITKMLAEQAVDGGTTIDAPFTNIQASDWTYSTDYCFTLHHACVEEDVDYEKILGRTVVRALTLTESSFPRVVIAPESGIDMEMLRRRDLPILFYDELTLYEDDLEDCGEVSMDAKIRVMPTCWFILIKFYVRIDHVVVRCRETRLFHKFGNCRSDDDAVIINMDVTWREKSLQNEGSGNSNIMRTRYGKNNTNDLPIVNQRHGIPQSFTVYV